VPAPSQWRDEASPDMVVLAIGKCLGALMDASRWTELGLLTGTRDRLVAHARLLRALRFGDEDYQAAVYEVTPWVLDDRGRGQADSRGVSRRFRNLDLVSDFVDAPVWLAEHEPAIHSQVCTGTGGGPTATLPDGTMLDAADTAAGRLGVGEMRRQVERIRRDYANDPEALIGQVKELVESACKTILGLMGSGPETQQDVPALVAQTLRHLGLHPDNLRDTVDPTEARALKRLFGGLTSVLQGTAELRNARGTGHGRSGVPLVDPALARLAAGMALPAVVYLCEAYEVSTSSTAPASRLVAPPHLATAPAQTSVADWESTLQPYATGVAVQVGTVISHSTFGTGRVTATSGAGDTSQAEVAFAPPIGPKRLLLRYAPIHIVPSRH